MTDKKTCKCGALAVEKIDESHSLNLYAHTDEWYQCHECGDILTHGIPDDHDEGMAFYDVENKKKYEPDERCCNVDMRPTKVWLSSGQVQFKCPECYRVETPDPEDVS